MQRLLPGTAQFLTRWGVIILAGVAWSIVAFVVAVSLLRERSQALHEASEASRALAMVLHEATERTFQSVDLVLSGLVDSHRLNRPETHDAAFRTLMRSRLEQLPYVRALFFIGADGRIVHDTDHPDTPDVSLADRRYFAQYVQQPELLRDVSEPLQSRSGHGWFNAVTRRVQSGEKFEGVIVAAMRPQYMAGQFARMRLGEGQSIALYYRDGRLIAAHPPRDGDVGRPDAPPGLFARLQRGNVLAVELDPGRASGHAEVRTYQAISDLPLMVSVTHDPDVVLGGWWRIVWQSVVGLTLLAVLAATLVAQYLIQNRKAQLRRERLLQAEKLEALGLLTSAVAHDIANLLAIVGNNATLLGRLAAGDERMKRALDVTERAVEHGRRLLANLRDFAAERPTALHLVDLNAAVEKSLPMLRQAMGVHIDFQTSLSPERLPCQSDETQLCVALVNLIVNARDAMGGKGCICLNTSVCSDVEAAREGLSLDRRYAIVQVEDTGPGMPAVVRRRAFDPFFTTKGEHGTGLGLAQVYGFMKRVGGEVRISSRLGSGTVVRMYFPLADT